jgi:ClpA/ClpB-like protein
MTIEMGDQGVSGFGGDTYSGTRIEQPPQSGGVGSSPPADARPDGHAEAADAAEEVTLDFNYDEAVPGFEASASDCFNRALKIARSLNHVSLSSDHLMLALTMDPNARRLLERVGDITQLREAAMQRLGRMHSRFATGESLPSQTSDLMDIRKAAREAASERDQLVAISDLINAFQQVNGRLTYGSGDGSKAVALMERIEQGLVPRVADAMTRIEAGVQEATHRYQSVQSMLQDLSSRQSSVAEQRQFELMDQIRRQVREAADLQLGAALREFSERLDAKLAELNPPAEPIEPEPEPEPYEPPVQAPRPRYWSWLVL